MSTQLLVLGMTMTMVGHPLNNEDKSNQEIVEQTQPECCSSCFCNPCKCCTPKPKQCVDCECYTPKWYEMSCDCGWFVTVDFLYWYGRENQTSYAAKVQTIQTGTSDATTDPVYSAVASELQYLDEKWDPGVRVGLGLLDECDGWDLYLYWTYYKNTSKGSSKVSPFTGVFAEANGFALVNPWTNIGIADVIGIFENVSASWKFTMNSFDFEIGRRYWLSTCFTMRPFLAIRGLWTKTKYDLTSIRNNETTTPNNPSVAVEANYNYQDDFKNSNWGVGFVGGFQPTWFFTPCFSLYGSADIALLWGNRKLEKTEIYSVVSTQVLSGDLSGAQVNYNFESKNSEYGDMMPILDLAIGLRWEDYFCDRQYHLAVDLGWEHHTLFDHNFRFKITERGPSNSLASGDAVSGFAGYEETLHNVSFGGLVVRANFGF